MYTATGRPKAKPCVRRQSALRLHTMRTLRIGVCSLAALCLAAFIAPAAHAQQLGAQRFQPTESEDGILGVRGADYRRPFHPFIALWGHYALDPLVVVDGDDEIELAEHVLSADLVGSMALGKGFEVGFSLPVTLFATGDEDAAAQLAVKAANGPALGDVGLRLGYRVELTYRDSLAFHVPVLLPTAADDNSLALGWGVQPTLAYTHGFRHADLTFNASYRYREDVQVGDYDGGQELGLRVGTRIGLDATWDTALLASVGVDSSLNNFLGAAETPVEPRLGIEHWFGRHIRVSGFMGTGLSRGVGAPDLRVGASIGYGQKLARPRREGDRDSDGILDHEDACPEDPEDYDGFEDDDGCPDEDNDRDGIADEDDACPLEPETRDGIADDDGCPDRIRVQGSLIKTFEAVQFKLDSAEIKPASHGMLREVAGVLKANPAMEITVAGHSDSTGAEDYNLDLSQARARSVRDFIVRQGVDDGRIDSEGYGEAQPTATNDTRRGRRLNRRVEFHIKGRE